MSRATAPGPWLALFRPLMGRRRRRRPEAAPPSRLPWDEVYPTLDLHGETADAARQRADRWLRAQRDLGVPVVRVITGRGLHSVGLPVLRGEIADLLDSLRGTVVARVTGESGGGAFRVELRRPSRRARRPEAAEPAQPDALDPELRREALEALAELGVHPTPALVEAEVKRLRRQRRGAEE